MERELNEGVKRIYADMESFFLDDPIFSEPEQSVKLTLKNNIVMHYSFVKDIQMILCTVLGRKMAYAGERI